MNAPFFFRAVFAGASLLAASGFVPALAQTAERLVAPAQMDSLDAVRLQYIEKFAALAMREQGRGGIPASITLAQGILETSSGSSQLAREANNHFGMKCGSNWNGGRLYKHDDEYEADGRPQLSCFRVFGTAEESYAAHTDFLVDPEKYNRYGPLFALAPTDYAGWARGLQAAGYTNARHYAARLIEYIERYRLNELDLRAAARTAGYEQRRLRHDGVSFVLTHAGETLREIAEGYGLDVDVLHDWNERAIEPDVELPRGTRICLAPKSTQWRGEKVFHFAKANQTLLEIAQAYGIRLDELRRRNNLRAGQEPAPGGKIRLQGQRQPGERAVVLRRRNAPAYEETVAAVDVTARVLPDMNAGNKRRLAAMLAALSAEPDPVPTYSFIPAPTHADPAPAAPMAMLASGGDHDAALSLHVVVRGDTLYGIARRYGLSARQLKQLNELKSSELREGQVLRVK